MSGSMHLRSWLCPVLIVLVVAAACGGGPDRSRGPAPSSPVLPSPPPPPDSWAIEGSVSSLRSGLPLAGARVAPVSGQGATTTDADGRFRLSGTANPGSSSFRVTITAPGHVERDVWLNWGRGDRSGISLDMIALEPPFSLRFYRAFVRNGYEHPDDLHSVRRWMSAPSFYVRTVDEDGRPYESTLISAITGAIRRGVRDFSSGRFSVARLETGAATRPERTGWINVEIVKRTDRGSDVCGFAFVGANPGAITLVYDRCACRATRVNPAVVMHEVGHAMGFFHVSDRNSLMYPFASGRCHAGELSETERHHAEIAYQRPRGNIDPDRDPSSSALSLPRVLVVN